MEDYIATEIAYTNGYDTGKAAMVDALREGIEKFLTDDETDVIISEGEVFVPFSAIKKIINNLEG